MKDFNMTDKQMELGQIKVISRNGGRIVDYIQLLVSPTTEAQFMPSDDRKSVSLCVKDVDLTLPKLECNITKSTLKDLIMSLETLYRQIKEEGEL